MNVILNWLGRNLHRFIGYGFIAAFLGFFALNMMARMPESNTRARVSRVKADMRVLGAAIETYREQYGAYPATRPLALGMTVADPARLKYSLDALTTWSGDLPGAPLSDPFSPKRSFPYTYVTNGSEWLLSSPGPDSVYNYHPERRYFELDIQDPARLEMTYDPTNGSYSAGDIFRESDAESKARTAGEGAQR